MKRIPGLIKKICFFCSKNNPVVAHVALNGVIGKDSKMSSGLNIENTFPLLEKAFKTKDLKAVAITINSPGGSPVQSELIHSAIRELSTQKKIPVYTFARDVAASGGYWLLLSGDEVYAHNASIIGSIGVIFSGFGFVDAIKKIGVERRIYTEGKNKAILDPFMPEEQENIEILKDAQRDIFEGFKQFVITHRKDKLRNEKGDLILQPQDPSEAMDTGPNTVEDEKSVSNTNSTDFIAKISATDNDFLNNKIFTGAFWSGRRAVELGLVDAIADMRSKMQEKFGDKVQIENITMKKGLLKSLFSEQSAKSYGALSQAAVETLEKIEERIHFSRFGL